MTHRLTAALSGIGALLLASSLLAQEQTPTVVHLSAGFTTIQLDGQSGGTRWLEYHDEGEIACTGHITTTPQHRLVLDESSTLFFTVNSQVDTFVYLEGPDGPACGWQSLGGRFPPGEYSVWVGTLVPTIPLSARWETSEFADYELHVLEQVSDPPILWWDNPETTPANPVFGR